METERDRHQVGKQADPGLGNPPSPLRLILITFSFSFLFICKARQGTGLMDRKEKKNTKYWWLAAFTALCNEDDLEMSVG